MILPLDESRAYNVRHTALDAGEHIDEFWNFELCTVMRQGDLFGLAMADQFGPSVRILGCQLIPRESVEDFRAKLSDGADPMVYDIAEGGVVVPEMCECVATHIGVI